MNDILERNKRLLEPTESETEKYMKRITNKNPGKRKK